jgi:hypothetical protein
MRFYRITAGRCRCDTLEVGVMIYDLVIFLLSVDVWHFIALPRNNSIHWYSRPSCSAGGHTGSIQSLGGGGDATTGGSGSGGRIAVYHDTVIEVVPYQGSYDTEGGPVGNTAEAGASGTTYIKHTRSGHTTLRADNRGRRIKARREWKIIYIETLVWQNYQWTWLCIVFIDDNIHVN